MKVVFKRDEGTGCCPYFDYKNTRFYLFEDMRFGRYEWCLESHSLVVESKTFKSELELSNWLREETLGQEQFDNLKEKYGEKWWYEYYVNGYCDYSDSAWLIAKGKDWRFDKKELKLTELPKRERITGYGTYEEIKVLAVKHIEKLMEEEKITLF